MLDSGYLMLDKSKKNVIKIQDPYLPYKTINNGGAGSDLHLVPFE
jgi:hypothetical protein